MKRGRQSSASGESTDELYRRLIGQEDGSLPLPPIGDDPHLLTSRVRKHYFDSVIKLLCVNYEQSQKLLGKNLRLPSAIWRCAKFIELQAVQACMLMQLYRENILAAIKQLKADTEKGKLYRKLFECLLNPSINDKAIQVNLDSSTPINMRIKRRKLSVPEPDPGKNNIISADTVPQNIAFTDSQQYRIPVVVNVQSELPMTVDSDPVPGPPILNSIQPLANTVQPTINTDWRTQNTLQPLQRTVQPMQRTVQQTMQNAAQSMIKNTNQCMQNAIQPLQNISQPLLNSIQPLPSPVINGALNQTCTTQTQNGNLQTAGPSQTHLEPKNRLSIESLEAEDQVMLQMEQLFRTDETDDDLFEGALCNDFDFFTSHTENHSKNGIPQTPTIATPLEKVIENPVPVTSLDERIAMLKSTGALAPTPARKSPPSKKPSVSKWICESYFQRLKLSETLDTIVETNRKKYERIKKKFLELFGEDDDDELIMSPLEETPEFITSCNERIAPLVVKNLMPYYNKGRIKTKPLFKSVAKHIIDKIIAVNRFPDDYEVFTIITDYFRARSVIRCVADFNF